MMVIMSPVSTRKELSHARIVEVAAKAIRRAGYRGIGVADIMKEAGLTHGGFYAHFDSRESMLVEAMQRAGQENLSALCEGMERLLRKGETRFSALVHTYLHEAHLERVDGGCVVAALACEMTRQSDAVRAEACRRVEALMALVQASLPEPADAGQAQQVTAAMVGALQLARTLGGQAGRELLAHTRQALIERHEPKARR